MIDFTPALLSTLLIPLGLVNKMGEIIGTLLVSYAKQKIRIKTESIKLDEENLLAFKESLRIGADLPASKAGELLEKIKDLIEQEPDKKGKLLDAGTLEVTADDSKSHPDA